jgi:CBS domain-containing protein
MIDTPISRLMTLHTDSIAPDCELGEAVSRMANARISSLLVVEAEKLVGIVTEKDVLASLRRGLARETPTSEVMTSPVLTVPADMGLRAAYQFAIGQGIHHLVVAGSGGRPLGIVRVRLRYHLALDLTSSRDSSPGDHQVPTRRRSLGEAVRAMEGGCVLALRNARWLTRRYAVRARQSTPRPGAAMSKPVEPWGHTCSQRRGS